MLRFSGSRQKNNTARESLADFDTEDPLNEEIKGLCELYCPEQDSRSFVHDLADVLLEMGVIDADKLALIRHSQEQKQDCDIEQIIIQLKAADALAILQGQAKLCGFEFRSIGPSLNRP